MPTAKQQTWVTRVGLREGVGCVGNHHARDHTAVDTTSVEYQVSMAPCNRNPHGTASVFEDARGNAFGTFLMGRDRSRQEARCVCALVRAAQGFPRGKEMLKSDDLTCDDLTCDL